MTQAASTPKGSLTPVLAIRIAWASWMLMLTIPFFVFLYLILFKLGNNESVSGHLTATDGWFEITLVYLLAVVPISFFWRGHLFRAYWSGRPVSPGGYLFGMLSVWGALEIGGLFSLAGCFYNNTLLPELLPALLAFMFYVTLWPSGRAMVKHMTNVEDPEMYEEPR